MSADESRSGFCVHCGHALHLGDQFCGGCGTEIEVADVTPSDVAAETADPEVESTSSAKPAAPPPALPAGPSVSDPGWHADPFGRFEYRYSDGAQWTDQVSINGVQSTDPVVQPPPASLSSTPPPRPGGRTEPSPPGTATDDAVSPTVPLGGQAVISDPLPQPQPASAASFEPTAADTPAAAQAVAASAAGAGQRTALERAVHDADGGQAPKGWPDRYEPAIAAVLATLEPGENVLAAWRMRTVGPRARVSDIGLLVVTDRQVIGADRSAKTSGMFTLAPQDVATVALVHRSGAVDLGWAIHLLDANGGSLGPENSPAELQVFARGRTCSKWVTPSRGEEDLAEVQQALVSLLPGATPSRTELDLQNTAPAMQASPVPLPGISLHDPGLVETLGPVALADSDEQKRAAAITELGQIGTPEAIGALADVLQRGVGVSRTEAAAALAGIRDPQAAEVLSASASALRMTATRDFAIGVVSGLVFLAAALLLLFAHVWFTAFVFMLLMAWSLRRVRSGVKAFDALHKSHVELKARGVEVAAAGHPVGVLFRCFIGWLLDASGCMLLLVAVGRLVVEPGSDASWIGFAGLPAVIAYFTWGNTTGQTMGRRLLKVSVVRRYHPAVEQAPVGATVPSPVAYAARPGWPAALLRTMMTDLLGIFYFIPFLWALFDNDHRTLGDVFAGTIVVGVENSKNRSESGGPTTDPGP